MCGFAGIVSWDQKHRVHRDVLERMSARIAHRGPDDQGLWINHDAEPTPENAQVGLAFRRLSIIDLDPRANQPFTNGRGQWLVFNGEIYNYRELREELEKLLPDYQWRTTGDAEVLLASYAAWEEKCVNHLNGMFAFGVWDQSKGELFLARDRMGQKPLYVMSVENDEDPGSSPSYFSHIMFASELSAFRDLAYAPNPGAVAEYLRWGYIPSRSIYSGVWQVRPGSLEWFRGVTPSGGSTTYFDPNSAHPEKHPTKESDELVIRSTRQLVQQAVTRQLVADVPIGCFLSGGVDSSVIAASMKAAAATGQKVATFTIRFEDPRYDESEHASAIASHLQTEHHEFTITPNAAEDLPTLIKAFGEPFADSSALPTFYLARETRRHVKVALSGDGGDELFGGYDRYRAMQLSQKAGWVPLPIRAALAAPIATIVPGSHPKSRAARLKRFVQGLGRSAAARYAGYLRFFTEPQLRDLCNEHLRPFLHKALEPVFLQDAYRASRRGRDVVEAALATDRETYLPNDLLTKVDRCSMLHALEVRSPFMDHELVSFAATLTTKQLLKGGPKRMLREAFSDVLPAWVFKRKKMGFAVPIGEWFRGQLRPMLRDHLFAADSFARSHFNIPVVRRLIDEHETERVDHAQRLYALLMLELWWKTQKA